MRCNWVKAYFSYTDHELNDIVALNLCYLHIMQSRTEHELRTVLLYFN